MRVRVTGIESMNHRGWDSMLARMEVRGEVVGPYTHLDAQALFDGKYLVPEGQNDRKNNKRWLTALAAVCSTEEVSKILTAYHSIKATEPEDD